MNSISTFSVKSPFWGFKLSKSEQAQYKAAEKFSRNLENALDLIDSKQPNFLVPNQNAFLQTEMYKKFPFLDFNDPILEGFIEDVGLPSEDRYQIFTSPPKGAALFKEIVTFKNALNKQFPQQANANKRDILKYTRDYINTVVMPNDPEELSGKEAYIKASKTNSRALIPFDKVIESRSGVCREKSIIFKIFADKVLKDYGIKAALDNGFQSVTEDSTAEQLEKNGHVWNYAQFDDKTYLVDVNQGKCIDIKELFNPHHCNYDENLTYRIPAPRKTYIEAIDNADTFPNLTYRTPPITQSNLNTLDYSNLDLSRCNLEKYEFFNANLINTNLKRSQLAQADLTNADLSSADLSFANLKDASLEGAYLEKTNLSNARLENTNLNNAEFQKALLQETCFSTDQLEGVVFDQCDFTNASIYGDLDLEGLSLSKNILNNLHVRCDCISDVDFSYSEMNQARFNTLFIENTDFSGIVGKNIDFRDTIFNNTSFKEAILDHGNFTLMNDCEEIDFTNSSLKNADFTSSELTNCSFNNANLRKATLESARMTHCPMDKATLTDANFVYAHLSDIDFSKASLNGAKLDYSVLDNVTFNPAQIPFISLEKATMTKEDFQKNNLDAQGYKIIAEKGNRVKVSKK